MKNLFKPTFNKIFFCALLVLIALSFVSAFSEDELLLNSTLPLFVPLLLIFFFVKNNYLKISLISFVVLSFLGDLSSTFFKEYTLFNLSSMFYLLSYLQLIIIALTKFKILKVDKLIGLYLLVVFSINLYFLYTIFDILKILIPDANEVNMLGANGLTLMILTFVSFGVYLNTQTKQSIFFLVGVICFVFSVIIGYVNHYYLYDWIFVMLTRGLYALGLYQIFKYASLDTKTKREKVLRMKESDNFSSEKVLV